MLIETGRRVTAQLWVNMNMLICLTTSQRKTPSPIKLFEQWARSDTLQLTLLHAAELHATNSCPRRTDIVCWLAYVRLSGRAANVHGQTRLPMSLPRRPLVVCAEDETFYRTNESVRHWHARSRTASSSILESVEPVPRLTATMHYVQAGAAAARQAPELFLPSLSLSLSVPLFAISPRHFTISNSSASSWLTGGRRHGELTHCSLFTGRVLPGPLQTASHSETTKQWRPPWQTDRQTELQSAAVCRPAGECSRCSVPIHR